MMEQRHAGIVQRLQKQIRAYYDRQTPFRIYHGSTNSTRILSFKRSEMVDTSDLTEIISIDTANMIVVVESNVPMDRLLAATLKKGLMPKVVPEFPGITVGGGIQGGAGESSSFRYGFLAQTAEWIEYILADGTVIKCSRDSHSDLFFGAAGSSGTMGVITAVGLQLIPAQPYVELEYTPVSGFSDLLQHFEHTGSQQSDFVDAIMFSETSGVLITGNLAGTADGKIQRFARAHDPWFYLHAAKISQHRENYKEYVPITDYIFRYDRGAFWVGSYAFQRFRMPFNPFTRYLLNPLLHTRQLYQALQVSGASQQHIVQDFTVPSERCEEFYKDIGKIMQTYPLWVCPILPEPRSPLSCNGLQTRLAINFGVWGKQISSYDDFLNLNRKFESSLQRRRGKKWLYAHTYYTEDEFWRIYDRDWYEKLREKYRATILPTIYEKVVVKDRYQINTRRGLFQTIFRLARLRMQD